MKFEAEIIIFLQKIFSTEIFITSFKLITQFGGAVGIAILTILLFFKDKKLSLLYLITSMFGSGFNFILKFIFDRPRPYITYYNIVNHLKALGASMPSSHSLVACVFTSYSIYAIKQYTNKKYHPLFISLSCILCLLVLISRMVLGQHYLSDILVGSSLGIILSFGSLLAYKKLNTYFKNKNKDCD